MGTVTENFIEYCDSVFRLSCKHRASYNSNNPVLCEYAEKLSNVYDDNKRHTIELIKVRLHDLMCEVETLPDIKDIIKSAYNYLSSENTTKYDVYDFIIKYRDDDEFISPLLTYIDIDK